MLPGAPLVTILISTQVLNAVLLIPLLFVMIGIGRDPELMGEFRLTTAGTIAYAVTTAVVLACVAALGVFLGFG
jgi:Mn2+/Fe2+ NRAMP family transporter